MQNDLINDDPVTLGAELRRLIGRFQNLKADKGVDKKWLNKVVARLEEVDVFCDRLYKPEVSNLMAQEKEQTLIDTLSGCTCPPGVKSADCPVHGGS